MLLHLLWLLLLFPFWRVFAFIVVAALGGVAADIDVDYLSHLLGIDYC